MQIRCQADLEWFLDKCQEYMEAQNVDVTEVLFGYDTEATLVRDFTRESLCESLCVKSFSNVFPCLSDWEGKVFTATNVGCLDGIEIC